MTTKWYRQRFSVWKPDHELSEGEQVKTRDGKKYICGPQDQIMAQDGDTINDLIDLTRTFFGHDDDISYRIAQNAKQGKTVSAWVSTHIRGWIQINERSLFFPKLAVTTIPHETMHSILNWRGEPCNSRPWHGHCKHWKDMMEAFFTSAEWTEWLARFRGEEAKVPFRDPREIWYIWILTNDNTLERYTDKTWKSRQAAYQWAKRNIAKPFVCHSLAMI